MEFTKLQATGNDFVLIEANGIERDWSRLAIDICDRHLGIGADSLLLLKPSDKADFRMFTFDADGSEAEICGNGLRCLARYVIEKGNFDSNIEEIAVETTAGTRRLQPDLVNRKIIGFHAIMGKPGFSAEEIPVNTSNRAGDIVDINNVIRYQVDVEEFNLMLYLVSMGNPHAVFFTEQPVNEFPMSRIGPQVENLSIFPRRTNFEIARVTSKDAIEARVWERGVGETMSCGSGACAIGVVSKSLGFTGSRVSIQLPGGSLDVEYSDAVGVILSGPAEIVFRGTWPD